MVLHTLIRKAGLSRCPRLYLEAHEAMQPRLERRRGERRVSRNTDYLQHTGGIDRRRNPGRRSVDGKDAVSFLGEFLY